MICSFAAFSRPALSHAFYYAQLQGEKLEFWRWTPARVLPMWGKFILRLRAAAGRPAERWTEEAAQMESLQWPVTSNSCGQI
jgi:hypothetical protein